MHHLALPLNVKTDQSEMNIPESWVNALSYVLIGLFHINYSTRILYIAELYLTEQIKQTFFTAVFTHTKDFKCAVHYVLVTVMLHWTEEESMCIGEGSGGEFLRISPLPLP